MKRTIKLTDIDKRVYAEQCIKKAFGEGKVHRVTIEPWVEQRTGQQNSALWLWATWVAEWLNDHGYPFVYQIKGIDKDFETPWNKDMIVNYVLRLFIKHEAGHDSTSKATTAELSNAIEKMQDSLAQRIGVNIPFPSRYDLMNGVRK